MALRRESLTVRVVLFDIGGTTLRVRSSVGEVYAAAARDHGFEVDAGRLQQRFGRAWGASLERSRRRGYRCSRELLRGEWLRIVGDTFGAAIPEGALRPLFDDLYERFVTPDAWDLAPGALDALRYLQGLGLRLGVLSNWDVRLRETLAGLGLDRFFDFVITSCEVGFEKPHARIFRAALDAGGELPGRVVHIGDSRDADIVPALELGLRAVWIAADGDKDANIANGLSARAAEFSALKGADWERILV